MALAILAALSLLIALSISGAATRSAEAAFPGDNGRFSFYSYRVTPTIPQGDSEIFTMEPDGTDIEQLTATTPRMTTAPPGRRTAPR